MARKAGPRRGARILDRWRSGTRGYRKVPAGIRGGNAFSIFVMILVIFTLLTMGMGSGGLADLLRGIIPQQTSEVSETGKGEIHFEVSPVTFAKYWKTGSYDLYKSGYWVKTSSGSVKYNGTYLDTKVKTFLTVRGYTLQVKVSREMSVLPTVVNTARIELDQPSATRLTLDDHGLMRPSEGFIGSYRITYLDYSYGKEMLGRTNITIPPEMASYLSLSDVTQDVIEHSGNLTRDVRTPFERMMLLSTYVRHAFIFSLNFSHPPDRDPISYFMFGSKKGGLKEFAGALALMGRSVGVPTRLVSGFVLGNIVDSVRSLTIDDAHYWVEAYFGDMGWIPFEASPGLGTLGPVIGYDPSVRGGGNGGPRMRATDSPPDLAPSPPYSMPSDLFPNTPFTLYLQMNNYGDRVLNWFEVGLDLSYEIRVTRVDMVMYPREEAMVPFEITLTRSGPQTGNIVMDPNDKQFESDEKNNKVMVTFNVVSGIDLRVTFDRGTIGNGRMAYGESIDAAIRVENVGDINAYLVTVRVTYDTNFTFFFNLTAVMGNSFQENIVTLPLMPEGIHALSAYVDPLNTISELNETNNFDLVPMNIVQRFEIRSISWVDETGDAEFGPGDTLRVQVQSNLSPGSLSSVMVKESDTNGLLNGTLMLSGGGQSTISLTIDHAIPDLASALVTVVEL